MTIKSIKLTNFRSHTDYIIDFSDVTILIGPNGVGKTNVVEAVWLLSSGRSWRTGHDTELIRWDKDFARLTANIEKVTPRGHLEPQSGERAINIELYWSSKTASDFAASTKQLKVNGTKKRLIDLLGIMPCVLFSPESIEMLDGAPAARRRFLDIMLSEMDRSYAVALGDYNKILKERNKLLLAINQKRSKEDELEFWDEKLAEAGIVIVKKRQAAIKFFNIHLAEAYNELSGKKEKMSLRYKETVPAERFAETLFSHHERDIAATNTIVGPHRDDWTALLASRDITTFGSRGEFRTAILALVMAQLRYIEQETKEKPILLLDDIFSELDAARRAHLAKIVTNQQTIITTTDLDHIEPELRKKAKIIEIK